MEVPWNFDVDYTDLSRDVLKALCPNLVVLLYERCRFHGGSMEFPWRFDAYSNKCFENPIVFAWQCSLDNTFLMKFLFIFH